MNLIGKVRTRMTRLAPAAGVLFAVLWLGVAATPCVLAMTVPDSGHDCPLCPPSPCDEVELGDCDYPESLDALRAGESTQFEVAAPPSPGVELSGTAPQSSQHLSGRLPPVRAGPRTHLLHAQFNE